MLKSSLYIMIMANMPQRRNFKKKLRYAIETILIKCLCVLFRSLPVTMASDLGGIVARKIGPGLGRSDVARNNLSRAMPELDEIQIDNIVSDMWDNLGRTFAEFPHVGNMDREKIKSIATLEGVEHILEAARTQKGNIYFTGHLANWEIGPRLFSDLLYPVSIVYRRGNNPGLGKLIQNMRKNYLLSAIPKGQSGSREIISRLKNKERIGILVDQKMNDGIKSNFFGMSAMTAPAIARLTLKYQCPILPVRVVRTEGCKFKVLVSPPMEVINTGNSDNDVQVLIDSINKVVEAWVREYPGQWIWLHNRWPTN